MNMFLIISKHRRFLGEVAAVMLYLLMLRRVVFKK